MKTQTKWQLMMTAGILSLSGFGAGLALADRDSNYEHRGMMQQENNRDDGDRGDNYRGHHQEGGEGRHHGYQMQHGGHWGGNAWWSTLTDAQRETIEAAKLKMKKARVQTYGKLRVAKAELSQLTTEDKPQQARIDKKIDEVTQLMSQLMKQRYAYRLEVRKVLNDEQRLAYDSKVSGRNCGRQGWHH